MVELAWQVLQNQLELETEALAVVELVVVLVAALVQEIQEQFHNFRLPTMDGTEPIDFLLDSYWIPIGLLKDSYWIPVVVLDCYWIPKGIQWDSYWIPTGFLLANSRRTNWYRYE